MGFMPGSCPNSSEIVNVMFSPKLQRSTKATEAFYLIAKHCFEEEGNAVLEWRCDPANHKSVKAALRLGFVAEGIKYEGTHPFECFYMDERHWPYVREELERWLSKRNFDCEGRQITRLAMGKVDPY